MGACAGCVGPNRRAENYRVNRLTEDSPIKSRVTPSELPVTNHKIRIIEELNESKRRLEGNNLISTLINSPLSNPLSNSPELHFTSSKILTSYNPRDSHIPEMLIRESYDVGGKRSGVGQLQLRKVDSGPLDENSYSGFENRYGQDSGRPFASEFKLTNLPLISGSLVSSTPPKAVLSELKLPNRNTEFARFAKGRELGNIPELPDEDSKTPNYVKEIRRKNGEDVKRTEL